MDRSDLDRAMADASQPSKPDARSSPTSSAELAERSRLMSKLFTMCPLSATQDTEGALLAYIEETRDIPVRWIAMALSQLIREPDRRFAPSVGEIRGAALHAIRRARRLAEGKPEVMRGVLGEAPLREERELEWARSFRAQLLGAG